jgi:hypothetical protein
MENIIKDSVKLYNTFVKEVTNITNKIIEEYNEINKSKQTDESNELKQTDESNELKQTDELNELKQTDKINESKQTDELNESKQIDESNELKQIDESSNYDKDIVDYLYNIIYEKNNKIKELEDIIRIKDEKLKKNDSWGTIL